MSDSTEDLSNNRDLSNECGSDYCYFCNNILNYFYTFQMAPYNGRMVTLVFLISTFPFLCNSLTRCGPNNMCTCKKLTNFGKSMDCHNLTLNISDICEACSTTENITELNMSNVTHKTIQKIPDFCFRSCRKLRKLLICNNNLNYLEDNALDGLSELKVLDMSQNYLVDITRDGAFVNPNVFKSVRKLKNLYLQGNINPSFTSGNGSFLSNIPPDAFPALERLFMDGIPFLYFDFNFRHFKHLRQIYFSGKASVCNIGKITQKTFENIPHIDHLNLAFCNLSFIAAETFERLYDLTYLNLSHNEGLGFATLRNVSYGLQSTKINVLDYSKVYKQFGLSTLLRRCDVWYLKNTTIKELYLDNNRMALAEVNALHLFPPTLEVLSVERNQVCYGPYVLQIGCLRNLRRMEINDQYSIAPITYYNKEAGIAEKYDGNNESCQVPKPKVISRHCPYLDDGPFDLYKFSAPPMLNEINFRDSNIKTVITVHHKSPPISIPNNIESMDASFNTIHVWNAPMVKFEHIKHLDLSNNFAAYVSEDFFTRVPNLVSLDASFNLLGPVLSEDHNGRIFQSLEKLKVLNISTNKITSLADSLFSGLTSLATLNLASNGITEVNNSLNGLKNLTNLNLKQNKISTLPVKLLEQMDETGSRTYRKVSVDLSNNTLDIACENLKFLEWIADHPNHFESVNSYTYRYNGHNIAMSHTNLKKMIASVGKGCNNYAAVIIVSTIFIVVVSTSIVVGIVYRFRWRLRYLYYMAKARYRGYDRIPDAQVEYRYDAFISYAHEDYRFIKDEIIVELEESYGLYLCIHQRDFLPGNYIAENILQAIKNSKKIVIVLTEQFLKSQWCIYEFNMARMESIYSRNGDNVIFCIMYEDIDTKHLSPELIETLESETFLKYPEEEPEKPYFWEMLKKALSDQ